MTVALSTGLRNGMLGSTGFDAAFANSVIYLYSGPQPATADAAVQGTLLMKITKASGAFSFGTATNGLNFGTAASGAISKDSEVWSGAGIANGTIGWGRLMGNASDDLGISTTLARMDFAVGTAGSDLNVVSTTVSSSPATPLTIDVFTYTLPAS